MQHTVNVRIENDRFYPDCAEATEFTKVSKTAYMTPEIFDLIDQLDNFRIVVRPFSKGNVINGSSCKVIPLIRKVA